MRQPFFLAILFLMVGFLTMIFSGEASLLGFSNPPLERKLYLRLRGENLLFLKHLLYVTPEYQNRKIESILVKARNTGKVPARTRMKINNQVRMVASLPTERFPSEMLFKVNGPALSFNEIKNWDLLTQGEMVIESISIRFREVN